MGTASIASPLYSGSFVSNPSNLRSACRHPYAPIYATYNVGFRVAL